MVASAPLDSHACCPFSKMTQRPLPGCEGPLSRACLAFSLSSCASPHLRGQQERGARSLQSEDNGTIKGPDPCASACRKATNALATRDNGELKHGIDLSKRLQRAILE